MMFWPESTHAKIVNHLRTELAKDNNDLGKHIIGVENEKVYRKLFKNFRSSSGAKGLMLTWLGLTLLRLYFKSYEIDIPKDYRFGYLDLLYLDKRVTMPYYIGRGEKDDADIRFVVFESNLALMLRLGDGKISALRDILS